MTSFIKKVAIVGAGGNMGKHTIAQLVKTKTHKITALTRKTSNLAVPSGVTVHKVDYEDMSSLNSALQGQDFLIITLAVMTPPHIHSNLVRAAAKAGVKWVMPNAYGFDFRNADIMRDIPFAATFGRYASEIEGLGMKHISLVCSFWYEWSLGIGQLYGIDIKEKKVTFFDDGTTKINTSTWELCGRAIAKLLSLPITSDNGNPCVEDWMNKSIYISSFLVSQRDMLDSLHGVLGTSDADFEISYQTTKERYESGVDGMEKGDRYAFARAMYARVFFPDGSGDYESRRGVDNDVLGLEEESLDQATQRTVELVESGWNPYS